MTAVPPTNAGAPWRVLLSPRMLVLHVAAVLALVAAVLLGLWQYHAWQLHREDQAAAIADRPPVPLDDVLGPDDPYPNDAVGRPVEVSGAWVPGSTAYVADRPETGDGSGRTGYWQLASLAVCPGGSCAGASAVPVVLGWTPSPSAAAAPRGSVELTGWLQPGEGSSVDEDPTDDVLPGVRIPDLLQRSDRDLYAGYVILDSPASVRAGLEPVTPDSLPDPPASAGLRNLLYAMQWWVFGGFAVFLWWRWCRDETAARLPSEA